MPLLSVPVSHPPPLPCLCLGRGMAAIGLGGVDERGERIHNACALVLGMLWQEGGWEKTDVAHLVVGDGMVGVINGVEMYVFCSVMVYA